MVCKHCGKTIKDNSKFCLYCGQKTEGQATAVRAEKEGQAAAVRAEKEGQAAAVRAEKEGQAAAVRTEKGEPSSVQAPRKKRSKAPIVAAAAAVVVIAIVVVAVRFFWPEPSQPSNEDGVKNVAASVTPRPKQPDSDSRPDSGDLTPGAMLDDMITPELTPEPTSTPELTPTPEPTPDSDSLFLAFAEELLSYVDQAERLSLETYQSIEALFEEYVVEEFQKAAGMAKELLDALLSLQAQAQAVNGIDPVLANAGKEYFNMLCDSQRAYYEMWLFEADYIGLYANQLVARPVTDNYYSEPKGYYDLLYGWYLSAKEEYAAITSCPACMEDVWKRYGEALDLNEEIAYRLYIGEAYADRLRILSAMCMSNRYDIVEELLSQEIIGCLEGEELHVWEQIEAASKLAEEMRAYARLGEMERGGYEFASIRTGEVSLSYSAVDTIYPSLYNSYDAFVVVKAGCISGTKRISVEAEIPGLTQNYKETFTLDSAYREIRIMPPALPGDLDLSLAKNAQIRVTVSEVGGSWYDEKTFPVTIKSKYDFELYNDEYGAATRDNLLCFLTPESMELSQLARQAAEEISKMTGGTLDSFVGYQETEWNHYTGTYLMAAGIMRALNEMDIKYINGSFSLSDGSQHILFPEDVLREKGGLCIETALLVASTLQRAGMHAYILLPPGHAQVAVEIWNGAGDDISGTGEYFLIETTALSDSWNNRSVFVKDANALVDGIENGVLNESPIVYYSEQGWHQYIDTYDPYIIDCNDSRVFGMMPFAN